MKPRHAAALALVGCREKTGQRGGVPFASPKADWKYPGGEESQPARLFCIKLLQERLCSWDAACQLGQWRPIRPA